MMHSHQCLRCDTVWEHDSPAQADAVKSHTCPECGHYDAFWSYITYNGHLEPEFTCHHLLRPVQGELAKEDKHLQGDLHGEGQEESHAREIER